MLYCVAGAMNHSSGGAKLAAWMEENLGDVVEAVRKTSIIMYASFLFRLQLCSFVNPVDAKFFL